MHGFKKPNVGAKLAKMGAKSVDGGGDPTVLKKAKEKTIGMISGEPVRPRLDKPPRRAAGGSVLAPGAAEHPQAVAARRGGGRCGSKMSGDD